MAKSITQGSTSYTRIVYNNNRETANIITINKIIIIKT